MIRLGPSVLQGISSVIAISSAYPLTREIRSSTIFIQQYAVSRFHLVALAIASSAVMITVQIVWIEPVKLRCLTLLIVSGRCLSASFRRTENQRALHPAVLLRQALPVGEEAEATSDGDGAGASGSSDGTTAGEAAADQANLGSGTDDAAADADGKSALAGQAFSGLGQVLVDLSWLCVTVVMVAIAVGVGVYFYRRQD